MIIMIADDSFNFHSLSPTIMFVFKWSMIVDDSSQNHVMRSRSHKQTRRLATLVAFEIKVKKLQVEDTQAYQEMMRMNCKTS